MSKHHQTYPNRDSGSYHASSKKSHVDHHDTEVMMTIPSHHGSNGLRPNGVINGDGDSNDTNNNHNKQHGNKRSAGGNGSGGETSSSKRTKLSVPSDKSSKVDTSLRIKQSHYNINENLKELYEELKQDKGCKEVVQAYLVSVHFLMILRFILAQSFAFIFSPRQTCHSRTSSHAHNQPLPRKQRIFTRLPTNKFYNVTIFSHHKPSESPSQPFFWRKSTRNNSLAV